MTGDGVKPAGEQGTGKPEVSQGIGSAAGGVTGVDPALDAVRALVTAAERWLRQKGAARITALVEREHAGAMAFWRAAGYAADDGVVRRVRNLEGP